jgi:anti-sigma B factor antagonist
MADSENTEFAVDVAPAPGGVRLTVRGELDLGTVDTLVGRGTAAVQGDPRTLTIDIGQLLFCDSAGVNGLVRLRRHTAQAGWGFRLINPRAHIRRVLVDFMALGEFLNIADESTATK